MTETREQTEARHEREQALLDARKKAAAALHDVIKLELADSECYERDAWAELELEFEWRAAHGRKAP